ncbi:MAG TPA: hypothetical protein VMZ51_08185 [Acidimicrobiales bacterium]|nr:hypothetical protein [Acidimicrobiales bacterium]
MSNLDDLLSDLSASGDLDDEVAEQLRQAAAGNAQEGSQLRKFANRTKSENDKLAEENKSYRDMFLASQLKELGVPIAPSALKIPDTVSPSDPASVKAWAESAGLISAAPPDTPAAELDGHDAIAAAASGQSSAPTANPAEVVEKLRGGTEQEFWDAMHAMGRVDTTDVIQQAVFP